MGNVHYDPERVLNGFTEDGLKELAKRLKRKVRVLKRDIIYDLLSPPKGKSENLVKVWQEINRHLRKELVRFSEEGAVKFSFQNIPLEEQFKIGYMFTLSPNPETRAWGENLYSQAEKNHEQENKENEKLRRLEKLENDEFMGEVEIIHISKDRQVELSHDKQVKEVTDIEGIEEIIEVKEIEEIEEVIAVMAVITAKKETKEVEKSIEEQTKKKSVSAEVIDDFINDIKPEETKELQVRIKTLEKKLKSANIEEIRIKGQLEKLKSVVSALKSQALRDKEEVGKFRNKVRELELERTEKEKDYAAIKQKLEQKMALPPQKTKEPLQYSSPLIDQEIIKCEIDLAAYQGRKALIFAERDSEVDIWLSALGIIPIWAMEIDWNRPRRRMSTSQIVLYTVNSQKLKKLDEIRDVARYWNIPCHELLHSRGRNVHDKR